MSVTATNPLLPPATSPTPASSSTSLSSQAQLQQSQFLNLLVTQLKEQNPLDPQDGTQFVTQLAQFSSLEELVTIRTTLQSMSQAPASTPGANPLQGTSTNSTQGA